MWSVYVFLKDLWIFWMILKPLFCLPLLIQFSNIFHSVLCPWRLNHMDYINRTTLPYDSDWILQWEHQPAWDQDIYFLSRSLAKLNAFLNQWSLLFSRQLTNYELLSLPLSSGIYSPTMSSCLRMVLTYW